MTVVRPNSIAGINSITVQSGQALNIHDASGNLIRNITSSSGVSTFSSLHVGSGTTTNTQGISVGTGVSIVSNTVNTLELYTNSSERLRIDSSGRMILGGSSSFADANSDDFQLQGSADTGMIIKSGTSHYGSIYFGDSTSANSDRNRGIVRYGHTNDAMEFWTSASERLRIDSSGRLLVGLDASVNNTAYLQLKGVNTSDISLYWPADAATGGSQINWRTDGGGAATELGRIYCAQATTGAAGGHMAFLTHNGTSVGERLRIQKDGKVGINDATPEELLDLGENNQQNLKLGQRGYLGQGYSTGATILGHAVKAKTTGTDIGGMIITESNSGGGAPSAIRMQSGNIEFHTAASGTADADFTSERLRIDETGNLNIVGVTTAAAFIPSKGQLSNRNIAINGAMQVAQRATSNTDSNQGYKTCDRFTVSWSGLDSVVEQHQVTLTSGTPYNLGFRHAWKLVNGDQTGGAGASDYIQAEYRIEAQDIACSGWHYTSSSSYITLSFWLKTSVSQDYTINFTSFDGTSQRYPMKTGTISANTWTKITKTVPGGSNVQFDNNTGKGLAIMIYPYLGNSYVGGSSINTWSAANVSNFGGSPDSDWYTTNDATFEITGFQLEVGQHATPFEHRSYGEDLARCQRYYYEIEANSTSYLPTTNSDGRSRINRAFPTTMRAAPSGSMANYTLSTKADGVTGYQSSSQVDVLYKGTFDAEI